MDLIHAQELQLNLTVSMKQALACLQFSALDLTDYVQNLALSNPLIDFTPPSMGNISICAMGQTETGHADPWNDFYSDPIENKLPAQKETFSAYLTSQLRQMPLLDKKTLSAALYLVHCLDDRGYLVCPIEELAAETGFGKDLMEQALSVIQMLDPPGVGARDLSECLIIQLSQGKSFNAVSVRMVKDGLHLLAQKNYKALCKLLNADEDTVRKTAEAISALSPIPSRGFDAQTGLIFVHPDAEVTVDKGQITVALNDAVLPGVSVNREYASMLQSIHDAEAKEYIRLRMSEAKNLIAGINKRKDTLTRLITAVVSVQEDFFLHHGNLKPCTMQDMAARLGLSHSTVSRAVSEKYLLFEGKNYPLRSFFPLSLKVHGSDSIAPDAIKHLLIKLVNSEDKHAPLSDEALRDKIESSGIHISRRTIAKYRSALGIPPASERRK